MAVTQDEVEFYERFRNLGESGTSATFEDIQRFAAISRKLFIHRPFEKEGRTSRSSRSHSVDSVTSSSSSYSDDSYSSATNLHEGPAVEILDTEKRMLELEAKELRARKNLLELRSKKKTLRESDYELQKLLIKKEITNIRKQKHTFEVLLKRLKRKAKAIHHNEAALDGKTLHSSPHTKQKRDTKFNPKKIERILDTCEKGLSKAEGADTPEELNAVIQSLHSDISRLSRDVKSSGLLGKASKLANAFVEYRANFTNLRTKDPKNFAYATIGLIAATAATAVAVLVTAAIIATPPGAIAAAVTIGFVGGIALFDYAMKQHRQYKLKNPDLFKNDTAPRARDKPKPKAPQEDTILSTFFNALRKQGKEGTAHDEKKPDKDDAEGKPRKRPQAK